MCIATVCHCFYNPCTNKEFIGFDLLPVNFVEKLSAGQRPTTLDIINNLLKNKYFYILTQARSPG